MAKKTFVFFNGSVMENDPNPLIMEAESKDEAWEKIAQKFVCKSYAEFRVFLDREQLRIFNKENFTVIEA